MSDEEPKLTVEQNLVRLADEALVATRSFYATALSESWNQNIASSVMVRKMGAQLKQHQADLAALQAELESLRTISVECLQLRTRLDEVKDLANDLGYKPGEIVERIRKLFTP